MDCLISVWRSEGCIDEGFGFPPNLTKPNLQTFKNMDIRLVVSQFEHFLCM